MHLSVGLSVLNYSSEITLKVVDEL